MRSPLLLTEKGIETVATFTCPGRRISKVIHFILDTGSGLSFLGHKDALQADIDFDNLPQYGKPVAGFGGAADARHIPEACYVYVDFDNELHEVELEGGILVYRPSRKGAKHWKMEGSVSLLGRDFLDRSGCKLVVNLPDEAYFEKEG